MRTYPEHFDCSHMERPISIEKKDDSDHHSAHRHSFIELSYIISGKGTEYINERKYELEKGIVSFILPNQFHSQASDTTDRLIFYRIQINYEATFENPSCGRLISELIFSINDFSDLYIKLNPENAQKAKFICDEMCTEYVNEDEYSELNMQIKLMELLILCTRSRRSADKKQAKNTSASSSISKFWQIITFLYSHYDEHISLSDLSGRFNLSAVYISSKFKKLFGQNLLSFLCDIRLRNACYLLASTDMSITDVALSSGFESYRNFLRVFESRMNCSPSEYRKMR